MRTLMKALERPKRKIVGLYSFLRHFKGILRVYYDIRISENKKYTLTIKVLFIIYKHMKVK